MAPHTTPTPEHHSHPVVIRSARPADVAAVYELEMHSFSRDEERFNQRQVDYLIRRAQGVVLVAEAGGGPLGWAVGLVRLKPAPPHAGARVYALAVHPNARGLRIGHRLLDQLHKDLAARGVDHTWLEVRNDNEAAIALYEKHGYVRDRTLADFYGKGVDGLRMTRS